MKNFIKLTSIEGEGPSYSEEEVWISPDKIVMMLIATEKELHTGCTIISLGESHSIIVRESPKEIMDSISG